MYKDHIFLVPRVVFIYKLHCIFNVYTPTLHGEKLFIVHTFSKNEDLYSRTDIEKFPDTGYLT